VVTWFISYKISISHQKYSTAGSLRSSSAPNQLTSEKRLGRLSELQLRNDLHFVKWNSVVWCHVCEVSPGWATLQLKSVGVYVKPFFLWPMSLLDSVSSTSHVAASVAASMPWSSAVAISATIFVKGFLRRVFSRGFWDVTQMMAVMQLIRTVSSNKLTT